MNRRGFLGLVGAGAAGFVLDPERLLWRPGAKTIFLPSTDQARYYAVVNAAGACSRGDRITPRRYWQLFRKETVWREEGKMTTVSFAWVPHEPPLRWLTTRTNVYPLT